MTFFGEPAETKERHLLWLMARTRDLLDRKWYLVDAVARELAKRRELSRDELSSVLWAAKPTRISNVDPQR